MTEIEQELIKATKLRKPKGGFDDRQDELAALAKAATKLSDDDFDELSNEAADWVNATIKALNAKTPIADFEPDEADEAEDEEAESEEDDADGDSGAESSDESEDDPEGAEAAEEEAEEAEVDHEAEEAIAAKPEKAAKPKRPKNTDKVPELVPVKHRDDIKTRYDNLTGEKDRFGVVIGTKTHEAVMMYERGTTSNEIWEKLGDGPNKSGGRFYNILRKLSQEGHLVERDGSGVFKLTHRDDVEPGKKIRQYKSKNTRIGSKG